MPRGPIPLLVLIVVTVAVAPTAPGRSPDIEQTARRELLGRLVMTRVDVDLDATPVREALAELGRALGITIIGRYHDDPVGHGVDPAIPITMHVDDATGLDALEMIVDQATLFASCTWQLRNGYLEVGTKRRLCASIDRRLYPLEDLLVEAPYFGHNVDLHELGMHPYRSASLKSGRAATRSDPGALAEELVRAIVEIVEPANWDFELSREPPTGVPPGTRKVGLAAPYRSTDRAVARLRRWQGSMFIILAPDFFHREVAGYEPPIAPAGPATDGGGPEARIRLVGMDTVSAAEGRWSSSLLGGRAPADRRARAIDGRSMGDGFARRALAALGRPITVAFDDVPVKTAIAEIGRLVDLPIIGRYDDDPLGYGIPAEARVTLDLEDLPARTVLEALLDGIGRRDAPCTWQVRRGYVEVGTKARLSVPAARTLRLYDIADLTIDVPDSYRDLRRLPAAIGLDLVETIVTTVEPDAWDFGQIEHYGEESVHGLAVTVRGEAGDPDADAGDAAPAAPRPRAEYVESVKPAIIRHWRHHLIVLAPDFIHRQLDGYHHLDGRP